MINQCKKKKKVKCSLSIKHKKLGELKKKKTYPTQTSVILIESGPLPASKTLLRR